MDAKLYVYAYLLLSAVYTVACIQYLNAVTRSSSLAKRLLPAPGEPEPGAFESDSSREDTQVALHAVLGVDSAAFACAVLPVAYVAVTGLLGNLLSRNTAAASAINPMWLLASVGLVAAHMFFLVRLVSLNSQLAVAESAVLTRSFVSRHASMLTYYRTFVLLITVFNVANTLYIVANLTAITRLPYVM